MKIFVFSFCIMYASAAAQNSDSLKIKKDSTRAIQTVQIQGKKPLIKRKADRLEFNIDKTPLQNLNGWDILKNTPNVLVKNEQISVQGNSQIVITINDRKVLMSQDQLRQMLENTDGNNISTIEVITTPPAKYDAQGGAVINIKMKTNKLQGYRGRLSLRYQQAVYDKEKVGFQQNFNTGKWQFTGNYDFGTGEYLRFGKDIVIYDAQNRRWETDLVRKTNSPEQHRYNFAIQYSKDSTQTMQFGLNGHNNPKSLGNYRVPTKIFEITSGKLAGDFLTENNRREYSNGGDAYLLFDKAFGKHNFTFTNNFSTEFYRENQRVSTSLRLENQAESFTRFATENTQKTRLFSSQIDYNWKGKELKIESGIKFSSVKNTNDNRFFDGENLIFAQNKSSLYHYLENILAAYVSGGYSWEKWEAKVGLRSETTVVATDSGDSSGESRKVFTGLFPTFYLMFKPKENQQIAFSYGKRIDRPNYTFLNPAKSYYSLYSYFQGDSALKSTIIHNLALSYTVHDWNFEIYFKHSENPSMEISIQNPKTFETAYHYTNIDHSTNFGGNISKNFTLSSVWSLNFFVMGDYNEDYFFGTDAHLYKNKNFFYNAQVSSQITLDKAKTWDFNLSYTYNSKSIQGSFDISPSQRATVILNKKMFSKKLEAGLVLNDFFRTDNNVVSTKYADQYQYFTDFRETQYFLLNLKYNFGNQKIKEVKPAEKTEEQQRL